LVTLAGGRPPSPGCTAALTGLKAAVPASRAAAIRARGRRRFTPQREVVEGLDKVD
jgi:hypothetical protein